MPPFLGKIIKSAVELKESFDGDRDPFAEQEEVLKKLLKTAANTHFGRHFGFDKLLQHRDVKAAFADAVPFFSYAKMHSDWWQRIENGGSDITWPGLPKFFARSSGTTGKSNKHIPVTDEMLQSIRRTGIDQVSAMANFNLPPEFFQQDILMLSSNTKLDPFGESFQQGEISGICASQLPFWFDSFYKPGKKIAAIQDWEARLDAIAEAAPEWNVGALSGIPAWIELMLKAVIEKHNLKTIHDIWPNLQVYASGGVAFAPYRKSMDALTAKPLIVVDTYLASEGFLAFQNRPDTNAMTLATRNGIYFEFVPFLPEYIDEQGALTARAPVLRLDQVEPDTDYVLVISTCSGAWRYQIGDTIKFTDVSKAEIQITGRTKHFLNVVGSQLSVNKLDAAVLAVEEKFHLSIPEYTVGAVLADGKYYHVWFLGVEGELPPEAEISEFLDLHLQDANLNYRSARHKALKGMKVHCVPLQKFYDYTEVTKKRGGQVKIPRVMNEEALREFAEFLGVERVEKAYYPVKEIREKGN